MAMTFEEYAQKHLGTAGLSFEGIELPAAIQDLEGSQGYMQFQLEPLNTGKGTEYSNYADIYFDYNEVVVTNEVVNTIGMCLDAPGLSPDGPSRSGLGDGSNPGQGLGTSNSPNGGSDNPNQSGH